MHPSRRDVLRWAGAGAAGLAVGCGDDLGGHPDDVATAVLEPTPTSFVVAVWSRAGAPTATVEARGPDGRVVTVDATLTDGVGAALLDELSPDTAYDLAITIGWLRVGPHRARTAPAPDATRPIRVAVIADLDPSPEFASGLLDAVIAETPELVISIGDFPYADNGPPANTLAEYRARHVEIRNHPPVRRLLAAAGARAIYDDHEFRNDWDAAFVAAEPARYAAAMQAWDDFFPLPGSGDRKYRRWRWGAQLECFLLDCRRFRSANAAPDDERKTMLGAAQRAWLIDGVTRSTATFKLILTSVPLDFGLGDDHWATFTTERDAILDALIGVPGVAFVSGDQHWFAAHRHPRGVREWQVGPVARGLGKPGPAVPGVLFRAARFNAGLVEIDGDRLTLSALGADGARFYTETVTAAALTPAPLAAALESRRGRG